MQKNIILDGENFMFGVLWATIGIPIKYLGKGFNNFTAITPGEKETMQKCREWAKTDPSEMKTGLFFIGPPGTGKTHLSIACLREHLSQYTNNYCPYSQRWKRPEDMQFYFSDRPRFDQNGKTAMYINALALFNDMRECFQNHAESRLYRCALGVDLLVLDDIGLNMNRQGKPIEWMVDTIFAIVDKRYSAQRPTIFNSNLNLQELQEQISERTISRMIEMTTGIPVVGADHRRLKHD